MIGRRAKTMHLFKAYNCQSCIDRFCKTPYSTCLSEFARLECKSLEAFAFTEPSDLRTRFALSVSRLRGEPPPSIASLWGRRVVEPFLPHAERSGAWREGDRAAVEGATNSVGVRRAVDNLI